MKPAKVDGDTKPETCWSQREAAAARGGLRRRWCFALAPFEGPDVWLDECEPVSGAECKPGKPSIRYYSPNECSDWWLPCPFGGVIVPRELQRERIRLARAMEGGGTR